MTDDNQKTRLATLFASLRERGWKPGRISGWDQDRALLRGNYAALCRSRTSSKNLPLACVAVELLSAHAPDTVRGNMYLVVSAGWLPDTGRKSYNRIQRLLNRLRIKGTIPFEWVVDNVRATIKPSSWAGLDDFADTVKEAYRKDFWARLPEYVEVMVEKDTVAGKLAAVTREYDVPLHPIRGYCSTTFAWSIARAWDKIEKPITVYYLGDHDPSGRDLERDIKGKLAKFSKRDFGWRRLGVNPEHFGQFDIIPLKPKKQDRRYRKFVEEYGRECAEVEAIPANELRGMLRAALESHIPEGAWRKLQEIERHEKEQWEQMMKAFRAG